MREVPSETHQPEGGRQLRRRRKSEGFNLAFLDVMSCGLGAVVLVFMLVKEEVESREVVETELLAADLEHLSTTESEIQERLEALNRTIAEKSGQLGALTQEVAAAESSAAGLQNKIGQTRKSVSDLEERIKRIDVPKRAADPIETPGQGEENYLIGLRVEGPRIVFLFDVSASMTDETLIDIIKRKNGPDANKRRGPKWRRAVRVMHWLLARAPQGSQVAVVTFSDAAGVLGGGWVGGGDKTKVNGLARAVEGITPKGGTNLQAGLRTAAQLRPSDVYLVTDGLPTKGESRFQSLNPFADCSSLFGRATTITGECRVKLFRHSIANANLSGREKINVVLLPMEGDPMASPELWNWASATSGLMITPAEDWP